MGWSLNQGPAFCSAGAYKLKKLAVKRLGIYGLTKLLEQVPTYSQVADSLSTNKNLVRAQIIDEGVPFLLSTLWQDLKVPMLIICPTAEQSLRLTERISAWRTDTIWRE